MLEALILKAEKERGDVDAGHSERKAAAPLDPAQLPTGLIKTGIVLDMVRVEPQTFWMGSPESEMGRDSDEPYRRVKITRTYWLGETEVTQAQWKETMGTEPWKGKVHTVRRAQVAATNVSWMDANTFCERLTEREAAAGRVPEGYRYALPTEAEWELACRAGSSFRWAHGDDEAFLKELAVFDDSRDFDHAQAVKSLQPNDWGFYDMHGNVWEWCADSASFDGQVRSSAEDDAVDPRSDRGSQRITRGGSYQNAAATCRSAIRSTEAPKHTGWNCGFRVALVARVEDSKR